MSNEEKKEVLVPSSDQLSAPKEYVAEVDTCGVPKNFMIRCGRCRWARLSSGIAEDLKDLYEDKNNCSSCGRWRRFRCPRCGSSAPMKRIQGNS